MPGNGNGTRDSAKALGQDAIADTKCSTRVIAYESWPLLCDRAPGKRRFPLAKKKTKKRCVTLSVLLALHKQSRFGDKLPGIWLVCPQNGTAVLKGLIVATLESSRTKGGGSAKSARAAELLVSLHTWYHTTSSYLWYSSSPVPWYYYRFTQGVLPVSYG